jgi:hypothetical protein
VKTTDAAFGPEVSSCPSPLIHHGRGEIPRVTENGPRPVRSARRHLRAARCANESLALAFLRAQRIASAFSRFDFSDGFSQNLLRFISRKTPSRCIFFLSTRRAWSNLKELLLRMLAAALLMGEAVDGSRSTDRKALGCPPAQSRRLRWLCTSCQPMRLSTARSNSRMDISQSAGARNPRKRQANLGFILTGKKAA